MSGPWQSIPSTPATLYAAGSGVFKSTNGGGSWTAINAGMASAFVYSLAVDPSAPATLYAGTFDGVFGGRNEKGRWGQICEDVSWTLASHPS